MEQTVGVLSLQGDFLKHKQAIEQCGHQALYVRDVGGLNACDKLIIPGGESTTMLLLIDKLNLRDELIKFGQTKAIMGTCAGLIVLATTREHLPSDPLKLIDVKVKRNAYGRQVDSFIDTVQLDLNGAKRAFEGVFIRAPKIVELGSGVKPLAYHGQDVVMARNERILVATFHPELTDDSTIHRYFIENFD